MLLHYPNCRTQVDAVPLTTRTSLVLDLSEHCIETAARHAYRSLVDTFLDCPGRNLDLEEKLVLLHDFLEAADFAKLRAKHTELAGGSRLRVRLQRSESGEVTWSVVV